jgi:site-specific DNA-methyltransferase (adenine-specific)
LNITNADINSIIPYAFNNRKHDAVQVERIANSIQSFGFNQPIVVDEGNVILVGHGRLEAAKRLGLKTVPVLRIENLTSTQKKAYRILDNKLQNDSEWDFDSLRIELAELEEADFDLDEWGLNDLTSLFEKEAEVVEDDDFEPEIAAEPYIKAGDLITLGNHRLLCGDSTKAEDVATLMGGQTADLMLTDPPYNVDYTGKTKDALKVANDSMGDSDFRKFLSDCFVKAFDVMKPGASFYIFHADSEGYNFRGAVKDCDQVVRQCLIWQKDVMVFGRQDYQWQHEPCLYGWKEGSAHGWYSDRKQTTLLRFERPKRSEEHPTMKPLPLFSYLMGNSTAPQGLVYDPFLGSGTTLIAAEQLGRKCSGMEISPQYCQVIVERYKNYCKTAGKKFECTINGEVVDEAWTETEAANRRGSRED